MDNFTSSTLFKIIKKFFFVPTILVVIVYATGIRSNPFDIQQESEYQLVQEDQTTREFITKNLS
ncbi:hypothetical protein [Aquimarina sp. 2201CG5-10]|uniref:hypothetical protein n=1 Tax=Aquimarina callyspongiae TaxID=3098150 RepID=UPI002AB4B997|nr:hypothetical protein [Aquimarina sp. 2201CG5-10]MDY8138911.1 hypothetical protein [Aquimarina sp. 2201CG5-10]